MTIVQDVTDRELVLQSLRHIKKLRREIEVERSARTEPIAIVGMACRFPGRSRFTGEVLVLPGEGI